MENNSMQEQMRKDGDLKHEVCRRLETKFKDVGLKFTLDLCGSYPVQAFGVIHGMRFYFRYRSDYAALKVGLFDHKREKEIYDRNMVRWNKDDQVWRERIAAAGENGLSKDDKMDFVLHEITKPTMATGKESDATPTLVKKYCYNPNVTGEPINGHLTPEQAEQVFTELVEGLRDIEWRWGDEAFPEEQYENAKKN